MPFAKGVNQIFYINFFYNRCKVKFIRSGALEIIHKLIIGCLNCIKEYYSEEMI